MSYQNILSDQINILRKMSLRRLFNSVKVWSSFHVSSWLNKPIQWGKPLSFAIEPTTSCNLRCPECPSGLRAFSRPTGMLPQELFRKGIDDLYKDASYLTFYFQGEPYLHKNFLEMVSYASSKKLYTATSTNAHFLDDATAKKTVESGLDRLIISIDGTTQETYESYRIGGKLEKVIAGAENVIRWKKKLRSKTPHVIFQFLVVAPNEHQTEEVKTLAKKMGVDEVRFKTAQVYDYENGNPLIPENDKFSRYRKLPNGKYELKNSLANKCWKLWSSCVITWDGNVVPCCFDKDASHVMGSLQDHSFRQIWQNDNYNHFRSQLINSRSQIDICKNCTEGTKVFA